MTSFSGPIGQMAADEWRHLCEIEDEARRAHIVAYQRLVRKVNAVRSGESHETPTPEEWREVERTKQRWHELKRQMRQFVADAGQN
ncbi:MAG TPA: hypothetical protein VK759_01275 [Rhizomicrobium sp.]|nr:hypothetical protein [Rhizomicrobium sp.]